MTASTPAEKKRPRIGLFILMGGAALVLTLLLGRLAWFWYQSEPSRQITIGRETTYLDGPLTAEGFVDYIAALNQRQSAGVTPENNAVTLLIRAYGPEIVSDEIRTQFLKLLEIDQPFGAGKPLEVQTAFLRRTQAATANDAAGAAAEEFRLRCETVSTRPWTSDEFPDVAAFLEANAAPLEIVTEASRRGRYYSPLVSSGPVESMFAVLLPVEQQQREAVRQLTARAMQKLGGGDAAGAWEDLLTCHRLARLTGQSPFVIGALVSYALDAQCFDAERALLASPALTAEQARRFLEEFCALSPPTAIADVIDVAERIANLDAAILVARGRYNSLDGMQSPQNLQPSVRGAVHWDVALTEINQKFDAIVAELREKDVARRIDGLNQQMQLISRADPQVMAIGVQAFLGAREQASRDMGAALLHAHVPACQQGAIAESRALARDRLVRIGLTLAVWQREHGAYPDTLAALVPDLAPELPVDPFSGKEFVYRTTPAGYVLYSVWDNRQDDGGVMPSTTSSQAPADMVLQIGGQ